MNDEKRPSVDLTNVYGYDLTKQISFMDQSEAIEFSENTDLDFKFRSNGPGPGEYFYTPTQWLLDIYEELTALRARVRELEGEP